MKHYLLLVLLFLALVVRLFFVGNPGFEADVAFWKSWGLAVFDHGSVWAAHNTNVNYPPGFFPIMGGMVWLYRFFGDPHNFAIFWQVNNFPFLLSSKLLAIFSDLAIAVLLYRFARHYLPSSIAYCLFAIALFHPVVIIDSAVWGQVESFGLLFTILTTLFLFRNRPIAASIIFTTGMLMKLQNIISAPLVFLYILRVFGWNTFVKTIAAATGTFFAITLPFLLAHRMDTVLYLLTVNSDYFPWLSLNAHDLWWIVGGTNGMGISDKITMVGITNAKTLGLLLFSSFYLLSTLLIWKKPTPRNFFLALIIGIFSFFLFTTQSHERYSYPVIVLLLFWYPLNTKISNFKFQISNLSWCFWLLYVCLSLAIFYNIHTSLAINYPQNALPILSALTHPVLTISNALLLILLFFFLLSFIFLELSRATLILPVLLFFSGLFWSNRLYLFSNAISLTAFSPIAVKQDWGTPQKNRALNSSSGWKSWNRLSSNYFYFRRGFGTHANSSLKFDLRGRFQTFTTQYGVDTEAGVQASAIFLIRGDGKELFRSKRMDRFDFPEYVTVDSTGVKHLELVVKDADDGITDDHVDWLNPMLYK